MNKLINILLAVSMVVLGACREEFWPDLTKYENLLVVDGLITNDSGPYEVKLSFSTAVQNPDFNPFSGAQVVIMDNEGTSETLTETSPGIYTTAANGIQGVIGQQYKLIVTTPGENHYESDFQTLMDPVGISEVHAEVETIQTENDYYPLYGYQFYIDTELAKSDTNFLMWRMYGDYKYTSDFLIKYIYDKRKLKVFPKPDSLYTCFAKDKITNLITMSTEELTVPKIDRLPLNFVNTETQKLSIRYSLLVKQLTMTKDAFTFYSVLSDLNSQEGALYTQQPYQVNGNIYNVNDAGDALLGYFLVAGVSEKRIFVDRPTGVDFHYGICVLTRRDFEAYGYIRFNDPASWPLYVTTDPDGARALPHQDCVDCRRKGGSINKPDFWED